MNPENKTNSVSLQDAVAKMTGENSASTSVPGETRPSSIKQPQNSPLKSLRTYQGDIEAVVGKEKTSVVSIALAEQKREVERPEIRNEPEPPQISFFAELRNKSFVTAGIGLVIFGIVIIATVYVINYFNKPTMVTQNASLITFNKQIPVAVASSTRSAVMGALRSDIQSFSMPINSVLYLKPDVDSQTFLSVLTPDVPPILLRSLNGQYMVGAYVFDKNEPFILLTTTDYSSAFTGMLSWETTMPQDFSGLFSIPINTGTSTPYIFTDEALSNKDTRIIKDENGATVLLYSFLDKNTLLITTNEQIFNALLGKFITGKLVR